VQTFV